MSWPITPILGSLNLSGTTSITLGADNNIVEHIIPGLLYLPVDRLGSRANKVSMKGFFWSGSDTFKDTLLGMIGSGQKLVIPSALSGSYFFSGNVLFEKVTIYPPPGRQYPYYEWSIWAVSVSGGAAAAAVASFSGVVTGSGYYTVRYNTGTDGGHFVGFQAVGRWWVFVGETGGDVDFVYFTALAQAGPTWTRTIVSSGQAAAGYDVWWDGTYVHYLVNPGAGDFYRRGIPNSDGTVTWSAAEQSVPIVSGRAGFDMYLAVDTSGYPAVSYRNSNNRLAVIKADTNNGTWAANQLYQNFANIAQPPYVTALVAQRMALGGVLSNLSGLTVFIASGAGNTTGNFTSGAFAGLSGAGMTNVMGVAIGDDQLWLAANTSGELYSSYYTFNTSSLTTMIPVTSGLFDGTISYDASYDDTKSKVYLFYVLSGGNGINYFKYDIGTNTWGATPTAFATIGTGEQIVRSGLATYRQEISGQIGVTWTSKSGAAAGLFVNFATFAV